MFDLNLLGKPGLQPNEVNDSISFLNDELKQKIISENRFTLNQPINKSRYKYLIFFGIIIAGIMALGFIYLLPLVSPKILPNKLNYKIEISENEIVSGLIDLLLNEELTPHISLIEFKKNGIEIIYEIKNVEQVSLLNNSDFYGINIRSKVDYLNNLKYIFKIPWTGLSDPQNQELSHIKNKIGERFILSNYYDFKSNSYILVCAL